MLDCIVTSSIKGNINREKRLKEKDAKYRSATESLDDRMQKTLLEPFNWYKEENVK